MDIKSFQRLAHELSATSHRRSLLGAVLGVSLAGPLSAWELDVTEETRNKAEKRRYLIEAPHTSKECLRTLDAVLARGPDELDQYVWGCEDGDHTGYALVRADSKADAEARIPGFLRSRARIVELSKYTPREVRSFHIGNGHARSAK